MSDEGRRFRSSTEGSGPTLLVELKYRLRWYFDGRLSVTVVHLNHFGQFGTPNGAKVAELIASDHIEESQQLVRAWLFRQNLLSGAEGVEASDWYALELLRLLLSIGADYESLQAAVLLPLMTRGLASQTELSGHFGQAVVQLISGVLCMGTMRRAGVDGAWCPVRVRNLRRMLLSMVQDVRCVAIKLAERVVHLCAIRDGEEGELRTVAEECLYIYAPLANHLGIGRLKWPLEDLSMCHLYPQEYQSIAQLLHERRVERESYLDGFIAQLQSLIYKSGFRATLDGRPKHIYSIWRKMQQKSLAFDQLFDLLAVRIVVEELQECYSLLDVVQINYSVLSGEFCDYISHPKPNGYQSLHIIVRDPQGAIVEIQIRTKKMHQAAELGVAAHWKYKDGAATTGYSDYEQRILWLRHLIAWREEVAGSVGSVSPLSAPDLQQWIYLFTPLGDVIELPLGATPLDFAYKVHTEVGHRCIGAKVDGQIVPFTYRLKMGEMVEIITQNRPNPKLDWLSPPGKFIKTTGARNKIKSGLRRFGLLFNQPKKVGKVALDQRSSRRWALPPAVGKIKQKNGIIVAGVDGLMHVVACCCQPLQCDRIAGFITKGRGISIHQADCGRLAELRLRSPERVVAAYWAAKHYIAKENAPKEDGAEDLEGDDLDPK